MNHVTRSGSSCVIFRGGAEGTDLQRCEVCLRCLLDQHLGGPPSPRSRRLGRRSLAKVSCTVPEAARLNLIPEQLVAGGGGWLEPGPVGCEGCRSSAGGAQVKPSVWTDGSWRSHLRPAAVL